MSNNILKTMQIASLPGPASQKYFIIYIEIYWTLRTYFGYNSLYWTALSVILASQFIVKLYVKYAVEDKLYLSLSKDSDIVFTRQPAASSYVGLVCMFYQINLRLNFEDNQNEPKIAPK